MLLIGLAMTGALAYSFKSIEDAKAWDRFISDCKQAQLNIEARLRAHGQIQEGGAALFEASVRIRQQKWRTDKDSPPASYLEEVIKAGERARNLVAYMLTYSRNRTEDGA
ncbi:MAG: hypothetical protein Q8Q50_16230 [Methylobacter sp.]|nr:hypothetical protein [Methylobacter sp.]